MIQISLMKDEDIDFAVSLTDYEDWGNVAADFRRVIRFEPEGCFIARIDNDRVGMITTTSIGDYAFMGSLIVKNGYRRRGIGEALMKHAISYLTDRRIATIELDATFEGLPLYRKLGFRDKYLSFRLKRPATGGSVHGYSSPEYASKEIIDFDRQLTGFDRERLLSRFLEEFDESVYISRSGRLNGFALVYPRSPGQCQVGPIVAETADIAAELIHAIVNDKGNHDLIIGLPEKAHPLTPTLLQLGFVHYPPSVRMYLGTRRDYESFIFGILSPEKG